MRISNLIIELQKDIEQFGDTKIKSVDIRFSGDVNMDGIKYLVNEETETDKTNIHYREIPIHKAVFELAIKSAFEV
jgi:hypothetical protein